MHTVASRYVLNCLLHNMHLIVCCRILEGRNFGSFVGLAPCLPQSTFLQCSAQSYRKYTSLWNTGESHQRDWDTLYCYEQLSQGTTNSHFMMIFDWCSVLANFAKKNLSEWDELPNMNISLNQLRHCVACNRFAESVNDASGPAGAAMRCTACHAPSPFAWDMLCMSHIYA